MGEKNDAFFKELVLRGHIKRLVKYKAFCHVIYRAGVVICRMIIKIPAPYNVLLSFSCFILVSEHFISIDHISSVISMYNMCEISTR